MKYILILLFAIGCESKVDVPYSDTDTTSYGKFEYTPMPDTTGGTGSVYTADNGLTMSSNLLSIEKTVQELLIQYYKAGWMDASDGVIDLHNDNTLSEKLVEIIRAKDWRKIEKEVRSKTPYTATYDSLGNVYFKEK